jgi:hypothetical protein
MNRSDTWLVGSPGGVNQTASITLNRDSVSGDIFSADVGIGGTLIQDQFHGTSSCSSSTTLCSSSEQYKSLLTIVRAPSLGYLA